MATTDIFCGGVTIPGPQGPPGEAGEPGEMGINAFTQTTASFVMPAVGNSVNVSVIDGSWASPNGNGVNGQVVHVQNTGYFFVSDVISSTVLQLNNLGYPENQPPTTIIASGVKVSPGGLQGPQGDPGSSAGALLRANNLNDVANVASSRSNLGLGSAAVLAATAVLQKANNLSDVAVAATARGNLGLGSAAVLNAADVLLVANNLSDLSNRAVGRGNLSLQNSPTGYILIFHQEDGGVDGGTFTSGSFQTHPLNTLTVDTTGTTVLAANQFTLQAGVYRIYVKVCGCEVDAHQCALYNVTDVSYMIFGTLQFAPAGIQNSSEVSYRFTIVSPKTFQIRHICATTKATTGFGKAGSLGPDEIYSMVVIEKEAG